MELCEEDRPNPSSPERFGLARFDREGIPVLSAPARRVLGPMGWEGRALLAHLLTEFDDPWEHLYDHGRTPNPPHLLPAAYRVEEVARAFREEPPWYDWECDDPLRWVDTWMACRLVYFEPPLHVVTTAVRQHWRLHPRELGQAAGDAVTDAVVAGDDDAVFSLAVADLDDDQAALEDWRAWWAHAVLESEGDGVELAWGPRFYNRQLVPPCDPLSDGGTRLIGRCVVNRDGQRLEDWIETIDAGVPYRLRILPSVREELRRQLRGSQRAIFSRRGSPLQEDRWIDALIVARLRAAGVPGRMLALPTITVVP